MGKKKKNKKRKPRNRKQSRQQKKKGTNKGWLAVGIFVAFVGLIAVLSKKRSSEKTKPHQQTRQTAQRGKRQLPRNVRPKRRRASYEAQIRHQAEMKRMTLKWMQKMAGSNKEALEVVKYFKENAYFTLPVGPRVTRFVSKGGNPLKQLRNPKRIEVVFMPPRYAKYLVHSVVFSSRERTVRVAKKFSSNEWFGLLAIHEMQHAKEVYHGYYKDGEFVKENPRLRSEVLDGEVRAHTLECKLVKQWKPRAYKALMDSPPLPLYPRIKPNFTLVRRLFPTARPGHPEAGLVLAALNLCKLFHDHGASRRLYMKVMRDLSTTPQHFRRR